MDAEEKIREDMEALGCTSYKQATLAYYLYLHLIDNKLMYDTEYIYNKDIDLLYLVARPNKKSKLNIYVPVHSSDEISYDRIRKLRDNLCTVETGPIINIATLSNDMEVVIYTYEKGLIDIETPDDRNPRGRHAKKLERRRLMQRELYRNRDRILQDALNGGFVEDEPYRSLANYESNQP